MSMKNSNNTIGTFWLVAQCHNQLRLSVHHKSHMELPVIEPASTAADRRLHANNEKQFNFERFVSWKFRDHKSNEDVMLYGKATDVVGRMQVLRVFC
jgi:hypothetical protein